ncbi:hypothetical protein [Paracidovorax anthurii]|uniref:Uncharacterized protein n=1 Tax=Paracidovorax anthurii TaxID=78229 RepID=A0A328YKJ4_9BURK|nr:hypothetical protein [Paracidovorax anthurii]RAR74389.1 hypothetical protein AX018_10633 [Paracidovorax anthurii]
MLDIDFDDFKFSIEPLSRQTEGAGGRYMDWLSLEIKVKENEFNGRVRWLVMPAEILDFKEKLSRVYESLISGEKNIKPIELSGVESNFSLVISIANAWGHLFAQYTLKDSPDGPTLQGSFGLDQSYLPQWIGDLNDLLDFRG